MCIQLDGKDFFFHAANWLRTASYRNVGKNLICEMYTFQNYYVILKEQVVLTGCDSLNGKIRHVSNFQ